MLTFIERFDFAGKTVHPFTTHAMSGLGHAVEEYTAACRGATIGEALATRGEDVDRSRPDVEAWLRRIGFLRDTAHAPLTVRLEGTPRLVDQRDDPSKPASSRRAASL
jgi:hypothetical protein